MNDEPIPGAELAAERAMSEAERLIEDGRAVMNALKKQKRFYSGWESVAGNDIEVMPAGRWDEKKNKVALWDELLEDITIFEAFEFGRREARQYLNTIFSGVVG